MRKLPILEFAYKGNRTYAHSTDIYNAINSFIVEELGLTNITDIDISIHSIVRHYLNIQLYQNASPDRRHDTAVVFSFTHASNKYTLLLSEGTTPVTSRYEYVEEQITNQCNIDKERHIIHLRSITPYSDIEVFTAMNKALLTSLYTDIEGKWLLSRFQTKRYVKQSKYESLSVQLTHNFNYRLTKSTIKIDDTETAFIYFSLLGGTLI